MKRLGVGALGMALLVALGACSNGSAEPTSATSSAITLAPSSAPASETTSSSDPVPSATETILAVLCDEAAPESVAAIEAVLQPDYTVSQLVDVRTDDDGEHAILGFVQGPGLAVLAQWTGTGLSLEGLTAADEFAAQVTDLPVETADPAVQDLLSQTVTCYTTIHSAEDGDDAKQGDGSAE